MHIYQLFMATRKPKAKGFMNPSPLFIIAFFCSLEFDPFLIRAISTIRRGDELNSTIRLVSDGGRFTLGFFNSIIEATDYSYFGIWDSNDDQERKVWVANPNTPMINNSGILTIDGSGQLKIISGGRTVLNISDQVGVGNTTARLQDSGNFELRDEVENWIVWQSFDHPTNTLLPGMKLGVNRTAGKNWTLTSWLSDDVPAAGAFTLSMESIQESRQLVIHRRGERYWTSGPLNDGRFEFLPQLVLPVYNLSLVSDNQAAYFNLSSVDGNLPMLVLSSKGEIIDMANNDLHLTSYDFCYGYESDSGCVNSGVPNCRSDRDRFHQMRGYTLGNLGTYDDNSSLSLSDCMERCWNNCSCVGFASYSNGTGCIIWTGPREYRIDTTGNASYELVSESSSKFGHKWIWIVIPIAILLIVLLLGFLCYLRRRKLRLKAEEKKQQEEYLLELTASDSLNNANEVEIGGREGHNLKIYSFASIMAATNDFSNDNKLGQGGFGPVYKGQLHDGREIAVKRLSKTSGQGLVEFKNELILIARLQHTNLVRILGCCIHREEKMLIYEYMPNKSLDSFLFDPAKREVLVWKIRWGIIEGVAQGLLYLHKYSRMRVIHRDLKASNVLLDENMNPKIADFGMARIFNPNETEAITNRVVGTYGYMSPEYAMEGTFSVKSDVFSFGVLILEIISGRRNSSFYTLDRPLNLIGYAWKLWKEGVALELKDPTLVRDSCAIEQILRAIHVGLSCVQESAMDRPDMLEVISMLSNEIMPLPSPKQPAFFTGRNVPESSSYEGKPKDSSVNDCSMTAIEAR